MTSKIIAGLRAEIAYLSAQLNAYQAEEHESVPDWAIGLTPQQLDVVCLLTRARGRVLSVDYLVDNVRHRERNADHDPGVIKTLVHRVRRKLGGDTIQTIVEHGYRATPRLLELAS